MFLAGLIGKFERKCFFILFVWVAVVLPSSPSTPYGQEDLDRVLEDESLFRKPNGEWRERPIEAQLMDDIRNCWARLDDLPEPERLTVSVLVRLNTDGMLSDDVELVKPRRAPIGDRYMSVAIDRALRAVRTCQPYRLPVEDYEDWEEIVLNFRHDG